jgi:HEAT repeat protein
MFEFQMDNDEKLLVIGVAYLALRVLCGLARVFVYFCIDVLDYPSGMKNFIICLTFAMLALTGFVVATMAVGLVSMMIGEPSQTFHYLLYGFVAIVGFFLGAALELGIGLLLYMLLYWLLTFRISRYAERLQSSDTDGKVAAAQRLFRLKTYARPVRPELLLGLYDDSADVRAASAKALLSSDTNPSPEDRDTPIAVRRALVDKDARVRSTAAAILVRYPNTSPGEVLPALIGGLAQDDERTTIVAMETLTRLSSADVAPACPAIRDALLNSKEWSNKRFRMECGFRIFESLGAAAVPFLTEIIERGDKGLKRLSITSLGKIGPPAQAALPILREVAEKSGFLLRDLASQALKKIDVEVE